MNGVDQDIDGEPTRKRKKLTRLATLAYQVGCMGHIDNHYTMTYLHKEPYRIPEQTGFEWVMETLGHKRCCYRMFRMSRGVFESLHNVLVSRYGLKPSREVTSQESLAMFLWIVGGPHLFSQVENRFSRSTGTVHRKFKEVLNCLCKLSGHNITPRDDSFTTMHERIQDERFWPHFKGAIGAIDGCHVPADEVVNHTGRHGFPSQNVMAICDFDMRFTFVVAGWPGSAHDTRILNDIMVKYAHRFPTPPPGKYYLVDLGYPNREGYLAPYQDQIYNVPQFCNGRKPVGKYKVYNHAHSSLRNDVERGFGVLKDKWRILKGVPSFKPRRQKNIIIACMSLHNYIRETKFPDEEMDKCDEDENYVPDEDLGVKPLQGDSVSARLDITDMNRVSDRIANSLMSSTES